MDGLAPGMSDEDAMDWLFENGKYIQERMVVSGWESMEELLGDLCQDEEEDDEDIS